MSTLSNLNALGPRMVQQAYEQAAQKPAESGFAERLASMVGDVDRLQDHAGELQRALLSGESMDVHEVMIAGEEAGLAFDLMLEIRNKLLEAYQEIMRLQA